MSKKGMMLLLGCSASMLLGCASGTVGQPQTCQQHRARQLESEQQEFTDRAKRNLHEINDDIERADATLDSLQTALAKLGRAVGPVVILEHPQPGMQAPTGLCPLALHDADLDIEVRWDKFHVTAVVTARRERNVREIRRLARYMADSFSGYTPAASARAWNRGTGDLTTVRARSIASELHTEDVRQGVRLIFAPGADHVARLAVEVERDATFLENQHCGEGLT